MRKLPAAEKMARMNRLKARLPGLPLRGPFEPPQSFIDAMMSMVDGTEGALRHVPWDVCYSREDELNGVKWLKEWTHDGHGECKDSASSTQEVHFSINSSLGLMQCLHHRGVAADLANLCKCEDHDALVQMLLQEYQRSHPTGFGKISMEQLQRADREAWRVAAEGTTSGLGPDDVGILPTTAALRPAISDSALKLLLLPLPMASSSKRQVEVKTEVNAEGPGRKARRTQAKAKARAADKPRMPPRLPEKPRGTSLTPEGAATCFAHNLKTCSMSSNHESNGCGHSRHACTMCYNNHPYLGCPQKQ